MLKEVILFIILSPGFLISLVSTSGKPYKFSYISVLIHALIFSVALYYIEYIPGLNQIEDFENPCYTVDNLNAEKNGGIILGALAMLIIRYVYDLFSKPSYAPQQTYQVRV
jgi:hypothetical protein